ncbi:MAG: PepSY domain-containing protein [Peptostreptococcaceae bacterium]|nr:PepSY domain-containing protein [Peptostreptococcaceae bacterium]
MKANKKRKLPVAIAAGAMALSLAAGSVSAFASPTKGGFIGEAKAKQIALKNAGLKESEVSFVRIGLGFDDGRYEYDVEFYKGNVEYDYEIDAKTGKIVEFDKDIEDFVIPGSNVASITVDKAKEIALKHAGLKASQVSFVKAELDEDNGKPVFDIEFYKGKVEYDYEIDAKTGKVLEFDFDIDGFVIPGNNMASITVDKAKEIALKHVGLKASQVKFVKAELGEDDGLLVYDIEFYAGNVEYDFEIDAKTGKIVDFDKDIEDFVIPGNEAKTISLAEAKKIALDYVWLKEPLVSFVKAELTQKDGKPVYDIEFYRGSMEYDYDIDAKTGKILSFDYDIDAPTPDNNATITLAQAKKISLDYVWLKEPLVSFVKAELTQKDGKPVYDIEFYRASMEYDFEIDAKSGKIVEFDYDIEGFVIPDNNASISLDKAKEIALNYAGVNASQVKFVKAKLEKDDGRLIYDIEFYAGNVEYDFEIDAKTGKILEFDKDIENFVIPGNESSSITLEKAKQIALNYVGLSASQVTFTKAKLDKDDGRLTYEIKFYAGNTEYDFEIDAQTGRILDFDYEVEDDWDDWDDDDD